MTASLDGSPVTSTESQPNRDPSRERAPADLRVLLGALGTGVALDIALRRPMASTATAAAVLVVSVGLVLSRRLESRQSQVLVGAAALFGVAASIRASPLLVSLNLLAASSLLVVAVSVSTSGRVGELSIRDLAKRPRGMLADAAGGIGFMYRFVALNNGEHQRRHLGAVVSGAAFAIPIVVVLVGLLASGDALTAATLDGLVGTGVIDHTFVVLVGFVVGSAMLFGAASFDEERSPDTTRFVGATEALVVLGSIAAVFLGFTALQVAGALGVAENVLDSPAATSEWAREGFFQLLWASGIALVVMLVLDAITKRASLRSAKLFGRLSALTAGLTVLVVGAAVVRIVRYADTFGLTMLRLYSGLFAVWIGVVFILHGLRSLRPHGWGSRFVGGSLVAGLGILVALNLANPEAIVVNWHAANPQRADTAYLLRDLSDDSVPALIGLLRDLDPGVAAGVTEQLCDQQLPASDGLLSWNWSRQNARSTLEAFCRARQS